MSLIYNPIRKTGFVATPDSMEELQEYLSQFSGPEAAIAQTCAWMAWNLASDIIEEYVDLEEL